MDFGPDSFDFGLLARAPKPPDAAQGDAAPVDPRPDHATDEPSSDAAEDQPGEGG